MKAPVVFPVIHYLTAELALKNAEIAVDAGCEGVFLIHMDGANDLLAPVAKDIKSRWPGLKVGVNYLGWTPLRAATQNVSDGLDMTWTDVQLTHSQADSWAEARAVKSFLKSVDMTWADVQQTRSQADSWAEARAVKSFLTALPREKAHLFFSAVAFKYQKSEPDPATASWLALEHGFIPTTSGDATGKAADTEKLRLIRESLGETHPLAIASGVTPENAAEHAPYLTHILVATGVSESFHEFDYEKLCRLRAALGCA